MSVMASAKARLSSFEYVPSVQYTFHSGMSSPTLCAHRFADRLAVGRYPEVLDEPVARGRRGLLGKRCVGVEVPTIEGDQFLGLRGGFVYLALDFGEGAYIVFGEDRQQGFGCDVGNPP